LNTSQSVPVDLQITEIFFSDYKRVKQCSPGPALADAGPNARPGCGAQCKT